jgi:5'-nucleotidase (lipoprotein e(P4) family)
MSTFIRSFLISASFALAACAGQRPAASAFDHEAALAQQGVDAVLYQHASAEAYWLYRQGYMHATAKLAANLQEAPADRPMAVIVDIDETVLDNSPYQVTAIKRGKTFDQASWREWTDKAAATASPGAVEFLLQARDWGCEVFYITNRDIREKASTLKNLSALGFPFADERHLLLMEGTSDKTERRERVRATQLRDFDERFKERGARDGKDAVDAMADSLAKRFILLPNAMYGTWRDAIQGKGTDAEKHARMRAWIEKNGY